MRAKQDSSTFTKLISWYCRHSPLNTGKAKLQKLGLKWLGKPEVTAYSADGRCFVLHMPEDASWYYIYYAGTFETGTLHVMKRILRPDDVVIDIGANLGWYTVHIAPLIPGGYCHAFEPVPMIFAKLSRNCALNGLGANITLNNCALGAEHGTIELHTFPDLPHGHSSMSTLGKTNFQTAVVPMITLDSYVADKGLNRIDMIKIDVEGAEKLVMSGAMSVLTMPDPPVWVIELNVETSAGFGHKPADLLETLAAHNQYDFYRVVRGWGRFVPMSSLNDYENGDNAVCVPVSKRHRIPADLLQTG